MTASPRSLLTSVFGFAEFRADQEPVIEQVMGGGDALVVMPTGGGKSLCYQLPAIARPGVGLVVSPLIALMQDQVQALRHHGVRAAYINSSLPAHVAREAESEMVAGEFDLVYVAPERLLTPAFLNVLDRTQLALFAIDEAHCVSQWGHDFRPEYLQLAVLGERFPGVPRLALTATADAPTRRDILERLALAAAAQHICGFDRPNIRYRVVPKSNGRQQLIRFLRTEHAGDAGIVYCMSRRKVEETAELLREQDIEALPYHAGMDASVRRQHQDRFRNEPGLVMVATIAFGMGIDKPDIRFVAHLDLPKSLEAYYQETGRAGRDSEPANAWMCYGYGDAVLLRQMIERGEAGEDRKRVEQAKLNALLGYAEAAVCRRGVLLRYFGEEHDGGCGNCDTCLEPVETWDGTIAAQKALSCIHRTGQRFGAGYLADVLTGADSERIARFGHDAISTFGIGDELDRKGWFSVYRQLVAAGLVNVDPEHGSLSIAPAARPVLQGDVEIRLRRDPMPTRRSSGSSRKKASIDVELDVAGESLFEALREKRLELSRAAGVPPYVVFHDRALAEMAALRPADAAAMSTINGVGEKKLERYGETFLQVIAEHTG